MSDSAQAAADKKTLNRDRIKFGVAGPLYSGDESAFSPLHTAIIRSLGGSDIHLGIMGAVLQSVAGMFSWIGAVMLRLFKFNRKAMVTALCLGALVQVAIVGTLLVSHWNPAWASVMLICYLFLVACMLMMSGVQGNIAISWIGDLVPQTRRGWFVGGMAIVSNIGMILMQLLFAWLTGSELDLLGYSGLVGLLAFNTLVAIALVSTITNRPSQAISFIARKKEDRVNYLFLPLWGLVWFEVAWRSGRVALMAFSTAYLLDHFGMRMDRIILIHMIVNVVNIATLYIVGNLSDKIGIRGPLAVISGVCAVSMLLWVGSAWWGILPILIYQFINGAAGSTHWMLVNNLSLQVYPQRGRANFLSLARIVVGLSLMAISTTAGYIMSQLRGWEIELWGAAFTHYHIFFLGCTVLTLSCLLPLYLLKYAPTVQQAEAEFPAKQSTETEDK